MIGGRPRIWTSSRKPVPGVVLMKELHTAIEIEAPAERVGGLLTDFASYPPLRL
jgi:hypothetical protein